MSLAAKLLSAAGGEDKLYVDDVFSAFTRTGTGADVTVTTGIDMTKGYMLWSKGRSGATDHAIYDSARGPTYDLASNTTAAQTTQTTGLKSVSATGHTIGSLAKMNTSGATYVDFVIRKSPKFFDVVTWTGDGNAAGKTISHSLGIDPGMVIIKNTSGVDMWITHHRSLPGKYLQLESTAAAATFSWITTSTSSFTLANNGGSYNASGNTYVAYLFAHDPSADGIIQCGSFTTDGSGNATVNLGWEPQYLLVVNTAWSEWGVVDSARGGLTANGGGHPVLQLGTSAAEFDSTLNSVITTATGFSAYGCPPSSTFIYLAIRRPNKPPTLGTQVYNAIARTGTGAAATVTGVGFAPDLVMTNDRAAHTYNMLQDRLRAAWSNTASTAAEYGSATSAYCPMDMMDGVKLPVSGATNGSGLNYINHFFKRAVGVFDEVCYTGTGVAKTEAHGLGVVPELWIMKGRTTSGGSIHWMTGTTQFAASDFVYINSTAAKGTASTLWNSTYPTSSVFTVGTDSSTNGSAYTYVAYLFASKPGISKVGSYTGNGTSQTIDCGFTTGARFVLIKATSTTGNWTVIDTTRGLVAGSDPFLLLNSTAAEVTGEDCVDPASSGFIVNTTAAALNTNGVSYIYLAFA